MSNGTANIFFYILKAMLIFCLRIVGIVIAWACKLLGLISTAIGEKLEQIIMK